METTNGRDLQVQIRAGPYEVCQSVQGGLCWWFEHGQRQDLHGPRDVSQLEARQTQEVLHLNFEVDVVEL